PVGHAAPLGGDHVRHVGVDVVPDAVARLGRVDPDPLGDLVQRHRLGPYVVLGGPAALPDAGDRQTEDDRVHHTDPHRHVLDDVRCLAATRANSRKGALDSSYEHHHDADGYHAE